MYCSTVCNVIVTSARGVANPERKDNEIPYRCGRKGIHGRNCRTFASRSVCDCTLVLKANVDKGSNRNRSSSRGKYSIGFMASLLVVTTPARKKGLRTAAGRGRHRHFPLSFVSPAAKLTLATSQPPTVMSIYRGRGRGRGRRGGGCSSAQNTNLATTVQCSGGHGRKQTDADGRKELH